MHGGERFFMQLKSNGPLSPVGVVHAQNAFSGGLPIAKGMVLRFLDNELRRMKPAEGVVGGEGEVREGKALFFHSVPIFLQGLRMLKLGCHPSKHLVLAVF